MKDFYFCIQNFNPVTMKNVYLYCLTFLFFATTPVWAQEVEKDMYELSLEELMNIPINSASKKDETLFDAPLSSYTITRADIDKAGSTSIMEALRMAPGVIVREQTNGVYDIHIRGFDNILGHGDTYTKSNLATLVMIDNRPVFNHNLGGTFWEALPIDINDVDRIEIVRGPSAPLFGPNAVTGVINIITKRAGQKDFASASVQFGVPSTMIANGSYGKRINDKFNFGISGNYQDRQRYDKQYYAPSLDTYLDLNDIFPDDKGYPHPDIAMKKRGANVFLNFKPAEKISFDLSFGSQRSEAQKIFVGSRAAYMTTANSQTKYIKLETNLHGLTLRGSYLNGSDDLNHDTAPSQYDYTIADILAEYSIKVGDNISITPGVSYQDVRFDDEDYKDKGLTFLNGKTAKINTLAGYLRTDIKLLKNWRVLASARVDKFSVPDKSYLAYEFASTYNLNKSNLIRLAITRSYSGSFIGNNFIDLAIPVDPVNLPGLTLTRSGNQDLELFRISMIEFGYRSQLSENLQLDIDVFHQKGENFTAALITKLHALPPGYPPVPEIQHFENVPTVANQLGATISVNCIVNEKLHIKPFVTIQQTKIKDLPSSYNTIEVDQTLVYINTTHKNTPSFYGGYYIDYRVSKLFGLNMNGYYFKGHRQYDQNDKTDSNKTGDISGKFLLNVKGTFNVTKEFNFYFNFRNALDSKSREYYSGDHTAGIYMVGASFNLN